MYSSFNVLGISLILSLGSLIIILDSFLEPVIAWLKKRKFLKQMRNDQYHRTGSHPLGAILEWPTTSALQLQRLAHEEAGYGKWEGCDGANPVTMSGEKLGLLDVEEIERPFLKRNRQSIRRIDTGFDTLIEEQGTPEKMNKDHDIMLDTAKLPTSEIK